MKRPWLLPLGVFLFCAAVYGAAGPGRIDMIDGQYRFEVARNILDYHSVQIGDVFLGGSVSGVLGEYSSYDISGSLTPLPLELRRLTVSPVNRGSMQIQTKYCRRTSGITGYPGNHATQLGSCP